MTKQTDKNNKQAIVFAIGFLLFYLFLNFFFEKIWLWAFLPLLLFAIGFVVFAIRGVIRKQKTVLYIILAVVLVVVGNELAKSETFKSRTVLNAVLRDDLSVIYLRFRENKTFELNASIMFRNETFTGKYTLEGDKLIFLDKHYSNDFIPDTLTIGKDKIYFQFDSTGKPLSNFAAYFYITENNLKSDL